MSWLAERLRANGSVTIADAAAALDVSEMTVRRDIAELEERGAARRVRGGARAVAPTSFDERRQRAPRAKSRIAAKLAALVPASGMVAFDASSTVMRVIGSVQATDLTVLTNGTDTFSALQGVPGVAGLITGGRLDNRTGTLVGPLACRSAAQFSVERFFTSAAAVDPVVGALELSLDEAEVKRTIAASASEVVLAVDSSKLDERATAVSYGWDDIDFLVTELDPSHTRLAPFRDLATLL